ncbi:BamA/TamA family outer membrane protein [Terrimonas sp. NA20]|uniref:BamA/TamA family outer membrane protein n=1 Tax=Terrimonas ginsenosidimutans TaxID=2908004 RepID=A0ABS9KYQ2_9BACT|nr:BamA/TamA family outer membrane protein [Terrimonas ginsenosidimutans]MCG2617445.1 BamA/TamA family outer membrane protein [Terrimonas ginsenosidimutans]
MRQLFFLTALLATTFLSAQDSVRYRVILVGDAGELNKEQQKALQHASAHVLPGKTSVFYLGDNIYPKGMELPGSGKVQGTIDILRSQYEPMRSKGAPVYFVPGNHDWDKSGPNGLAKIKLQWQYLDQLGDSLLKMIPPNGCPDPVAINLTDKLVVIAYDSEWWLYPFDKKNEDGECDCQSREDVVAKLEELRYRNRDKMVILASHHPFASYGVHGGKYTIKDHIFPLTVASKNLYIPLPVIGSLYPFLRSTFSNPEDLKHPLYRDLAKRVTKVFGDFPNVVYAAGHEHGLQLIKTDRLQVVSGAGAKHTAVKKGRNSLFADATQGYVTVDQMLDNSLRFTFYIYENDAVKTAYTYSMPFTAVTPEVELAGKVITADSMTVQVRPSYDKPGGFHRFLFGENYRKEWAAPTNLPVLRISEMYGGLKPLQLGGGMQSKSLRVADPTGKEWVIRSVEKIPDGLLPPELRSTFARDWLDDVTSAQHPFSALIVPPIANAVKVPHANPVIGVLSPDKNLGIYQRTFANMIVLFEEREPLGESDNSEKMKKNLQKDNDNTIQAKELLRARMLDALLGDWDRHEDQWRWFDTEKGKEKTYAGIPRDRDQVLHLTQGLLPKLASSGFILPTLRDFDSKLSHVKWVLFKTRFVNAYPEMQFTRDEWKKQAEKFAGQVTDSVLEAGLLRLPKPSYDLRHDVLLSKLRSRRERLPEAMLEYYDFIHKIVDIRTSDKNEFVEIKDAEDGGLNVRINKIDKEGVVKAELMNKTFSPDLTREIRLFIGAGKDSILIDNKSSKIKLRLIGGNDQKSYNVVEANKTVRLYDRDNGSVYTGNVSSLKKHISNDSLNTAFTPVNLYNTWIPLVVLGVNVDDGFIFGGGFRLLKQEGFRKYPYSSMHQLLAGHSFSTKAYRVKYNAEWIQAAGKADITLQALIRAPNNTMNYFGRGNETEYDRKTSDIRFYRTRFSTYQLDPAFRWRGAKGSAFSVGPSAYYYTFDADDNAGRFISNTAQVGSYDSLTLDQKKLHLGVVMTYVNDNRNNKVIPQWGSFINIRLQAYKGMGMYAKDFVQLIPEVALYKNLNRRATIILAERFGGTVTLGKTAFYQSAFLGGQENLLGYRQFRFAGQHSFYNNLELRIKLADLVNYILPGQFGITGFWDVGRVWQNPDNSSKWHSGVGGGIYFAPASMLSLSFVMGNSSEGWYPYFTMGLRF